MSSKDLADICSSDEWGESMDVADNENTTGMNTEENVNTPSLDVPSTSSRLLSTSPSVEMTESNDNKQPKSPVEMDPVSPNNTEVEMNETSVLNDDTEMKDLSVKSPEDIGELKSPSPTIEMTEENLTSESVKSPMIPVVEMKESEENEILSSPLPPKEGDTEEKSTLDNTNEETEAGKSPIREEKTTEELEPPALDEDDILQSTEVKNTETLEPTEEENVLDKSDETTENPESDKVNESEISPDINEDNETSPEKNKETTPEEPEISIPEETKESEISTLKDSNSTEVKESTETDATPENRKDTPTEDKVMSPKATDRCESTDVTKEMSDLEQDSITNFDDESQMSGDTSKDASDLRNNLETVEGVTVPGGADGDVNLEEESGDDPLGATTEDKTEEGNEEIDEEEILGDTRNEVSILPDNNKTSEGCAEGDEILPDTNKDKKKVTEDKQVAADEKEGEGEKDVETEDKTANEEDAKVTSDEGKETDVADKADTEDKDTDEAEKDKDVSEVDAPTTSNDDNTPAADVEVMEIEGDDEDFSKDKIESIEELCHQCKETKPCEYKINSDLVEDIELFFCTKDCRQAYHAKYNKNKKTQPETSSLKVRMPALEPPSESNDADLEPLDVEEAYKRRCSQCHKELIVTGVMDTNLSWETMDFCDEDCLGKYQKDLGAACANCKGSVASSSMGKYCVRFGYNVRQFCSGTCLEEFKKGLKVCSYCQKDITADIEGFLAPIGDKGQFKDFCSQSCMQRYEVMSSGKPKPIEVAKCAVCCEEKNISAEVLEIVGEQKLCSNPCLAAFKFANNLQTQVCEMCKKHFDLRRPQRMAVYYNDVRQFFCSKTCLNVNTLASRKIVACNWCKVKKYNFDMIRKVVNQAGAQAPMPVMLCSLNCLALYQVSVSATSSKFINCDHCQKRAQGMYHLTMSDATVRNFCTYQCCMSFQSQFTSTPIVAQSTPAPTPLGTPMRFTQDNAPSVASGSGLPNQMPVITNVTSLAPAPIEPVAPPPPPQVKILQQTFIRPPQPKQMVNKLTQCRPNMLTKGVSCKPITNAKHTQTETEEPTKVLIPVPVPIYVPAPMHMFSQYIPVPIPFPIPIPVPIFIPTTRNTAKGIRKEIKRIQEQIPRDPFEAELLMMAEMVAEDKREATSSESDDDNGADLGGDPPSPAAPSPVADSPSNSVGGEVEFNSDSVDPTPSFGEDMLQMAIRMASELTEPAGQNLDLETALPVAVAPPPPPPVHHPVEEEEVKQPEVRQTRKRGRRPNSEWGSSTVTPSSKRVRTISQDTVATAAAAANLQVPRASNGSPPAEPSEPVLEADPNLSLKYTYGVLAFRKWIKQKNVELLSKSGRAAKLFKTDILQLSTDELNFALCMFVREVRKPDGDEYAPDIIYYLCLGIQLYLYRSNRIDNIFTDAFYEKFTESLNEISTKFVARLNDRTLVTRVEEEHLWESQQLGAHSPHVLLSTLMFFNTKYFLLTEVEDHMRLSFTHVMKHWKRNHAQPGKTGSTRNVLLRYYPPQSVLDADERKKKVYEQQENEANPLRCPVKLYEFYVSKCPESVRGRNDVFYLLPERSCVPDSPVWYSTMALPRDSISKMLNRIRMVREVLTLLHTINY